ncbi:Spo0E family sporulation regulatory protein-aspartic acid phosphatase [Clostridium arbusti]
MELLEKLYIILNSNEFNYEDIMDISKELDNVILDYNRLKSSN